MNQKDLPIILPKSFDGLDPEVFEEYLKQKFAEFGISLITSKDQEAEPSTTPPLRAWLSPIPQRLPDKSKKS